MKSPVNDHLIHIFRRHRDWIDFIIRNVICPVIEGFYCLVFPFSGSNILSFAKRHCEFGRRIRFLFNRLIDGHFLCTFHNPLTSCQIRILGHHSNLPCQPVLRQYLHCLTCQIIISAHHPYNIFCNFQPLSHMISGQLSHPVIAISHINHIQITAFNGFIEPPHNFIHISVCRRSIDGKNISSLRASLDQSLAHKGSNLFIINGNIQICINIFHNAVIADYINSHFPCFLQHIIQSISINRDHHDHIHLFLNKILYLGNLLFHNTSGYLHIHFCPKALGSRNKHIPVPQPSLNYKRVKAKPDLQLIFLFCFFLLRLLRLTSAACCQCSCQDQNQRQDQPTTLSHFPYLALYSLGVISICFLKILLK